jgi:cellulose synthase/poly-beta-1,6-N-acetylglucosamine synthase-like glycosyltransferase
LTRVTISVIVPTRNRSALLVTTLRSVLRQRDVDLEVIVVDDASTDETPAALRALGDARARVIRRETPCGVSAARNLGAQAAGGDWLAFIDDDDLWAPDKLACQLRAARDSGRDWAYAGAVVINVRGEILRAQRPLPPEEMVAALPRYDAIPGGGSNIVMRRSAWQLTGPFDTRLRSGEDWEMWIRLARHGLPACVCSPLIAKRLHPANATLDIAEIVRGTKLIESLHQTSADWGRLHRWMAHCALRAGHPGAAARQFARAAVLGQARGVASDVRVILMERLRRHLPDRGDQDVLAGDAWTASAAVWLQELRAATDDGDGPAA